LRKPIIALGGVHIDAKCDSATLQWLAHLDYFSLFFVTFDLWRRPHDLRTIHQSIRCRSSGIDLGARSLV
jgi:hypothetical protein